MTHRSVAWMSFVGALTLTLVVPGMTPLGTCPATTLASTGECVKALDIDNSPPSIIVSDQPAVMYKVSWPYRCYCTEPDSNDSIRLTWIWGDGTTNVTNHQSEGGSFTAWCNHTYPHWGPYNMTVWIDDLTDIPGHNVSDWGLVYVEYMWNFHPTITSFTVDNATPSPGQSVIFEARATDDEMCVLMFEFGDGTWTNVTQIALNSTESASHTYATAGIYTAYAWAYDGMYTSLEVKSIVIEVSGNSLPSIVIMNCTTGAGLNRIFNCTCTDVDPDDQLRVTWYWGNGETSVTNHWPGGGSVNATTIFMYEQLGTFILTVWVDDLTGLADHNVSDEAYVASSRYAPVPVPQYFLADNCSVDVETPVTFSLLASTWPYPDLSLDYFIDFGDGQSTAVNVTQDTVWTVQHTYAKGIFLAAASVNGMPVYVDLIIEVNAVVVEVQLTAGWNLFSLPLLGYFKASSLGLDVTDTVVGWNSTTQAYDKTYVVGVSLPFKDFVIEEGVGYWIHVSSSLTLHLEGSTLTTTHFYQWNVPQSGGWVLAGFPKTNATNHASHIAGWCNPPGATTFVVRYDATTMTYQSYFPALPFTDFRLIHGEGYWVHLDQSVNVVYGPS